METIGILKTLYHQLWNRAREEGFIVMYDGCLLEGVAGSFHPEGYLTAKEYSEGASTAKGVPAIYISRRPVPEDRLEPAAPNDFKGLIAAICTLAHETGHALSWKQADRAEWRKYFAVVTQKDNGKVLSPDDRRRILAEEAVAWEKGRELLEELGFDYWELYEEAKTTGLRYHRIRLGILNG